MKDDYAYASRKKGKTLIINRNLLPFIIKLNRGFYINAWFCGVGEQFDFDNFKIINNKVGSRVGWEQVYQLNFWNFNLR